MEKSFLEYYDFYEVVCKDRFHLQGQSMQVSPMVLLSCTVNMWRDLKGVMSKIV